ncbi:MAG: hypothetical protein V3S58_04455 [Nitrosomonadaceae bacterium]
MTAGVDALERAVDSCRLRIAEQRESGRETEFLVCIIIVQDSSWVRR